MVVVLKRKVLRNKFSVNTKRNAVLKYYKLKQKEQKTAFLAQHGFTAKLLFSWAKQLEGKPKLPNEGTKFTFHAGASPALPASAERQIVDDISNLRDNMIPVSGHMVRALAMKISKSSKISNFEASDGWLSNFKKRHQLSIRKGTKRSYSLPPNIIETLEKMKKDLDELIQAKEIEFIINIDETPIVWDLAPNTTFAKRGDHEVLIGQISNPKKRITVILGIIYCTPFAKTRAPSNCKPGIIVKGKTTRVLRGIQQSGEELLYFNSNAWCTEIVFQQYLKEAIPNECVPNKTLLIFDGFSAHTTDGVTKLITGEGYHRYVLPALTTAYSQPLDVAINKPFKQKMRSLFNEWLMHKIGTEPIPKMGNELLRSWVSISCTSISQSAVKKAFECVGVCSNENIHWRNMKSLQKKSNSEGGYPNEIPSQQDESIDTQRLSSIPESLPVVWHSTFQCCPWKNFIFNPYPNSTPYPCLLCPYDQNFLRPYIVSLQ